MLPNAKFLHDNWTLSCVTDAKINAKGRPPLPAKIATQIPSAVHLDHMAASLLADPYIDLIEIRQDWAYDLEFGHNDNEVTRHDLVFDGLSLVAINEPTLFWRAAVNMKCVKFDGTTLAVMCRPPISGRIHHSDRGDDTR